MFDMFSMMGKVKEAQAKMKETKEGLVKLTAEGESGAGMVKVLVNGNRQILKIEIDESILSDKAMVQDLTVAAVNIAMKNIDEQVKEELKKATEGILPNIPGLDLGGLF